ncbi:hypothetical protein JCM10212_006962 [Sporobolomyces blumeae]
MPNASSKWKRPNWVLGKVIPALLVLFGVTGYRLVFSSVCKSSILSSIIVARSLMLHLFQILSRAPKKAPRAVEERRVVYACDAAGGPMRCFQDDCDGSFVSLRTRHCRDCRRCQPRFDHHCAFMDNCVQAETFKDFVLFILYAVLLLGVALVPLAPLQLRAFREVIDTTWTSDALEQAWWGRPWRSWLGGPVWHYAGAVVLGFYHYPSLSTDRPFLVPGVRVRRFVRGGVVYEFDEPLYPALAVPNLATLAIVSFATLIALIGISMLVVISLNARRGFSAVQVERIRRWRANPTGYDARIRLWIPLPPADDPKGHANPARGAVVAVDPDTPLFDFGLGKNWRYLMGERWWQWFIPTKPSHSDDFEINPTVLAHLQAVARKSL